MTTVIAKWGNSLAVRIPSEEAAKAVFRQGDKVTVSLDKRGRLIVEAIRKEIDFDALYASITPENRHAETFSGAPVGLENIEW